MVPWCHGATVPLEVRPELFGTGPSVLAPGEVVLRRPRRAWGINDTSVPQFAGRLLTVVDFFFEYGKIIYIYYNKWIDDGWLMFFLEVAKLPFP